MSASMPQEIEYLAGYLLRLAVHPPSSINPTWTSTLARRILERFAPHHWHPVQPEKGSGFRAVSHDPSRNDGYLDPVLVLVTHVLGLSPRQLCKLVGLRNAWTIWCDPGCVSVRSQLGGGEVHQLFGSLPAHLAHLARPSSSTPPFIGSTLPHSPSPSPAVNRTESPSPNKSRAIPILAPNTQTVKFSGVTGFAVTPPTPVQGNSDSGCSPRVLEDDASDDERTLSDELTRSFAVESDPLIDDDPFMRPCSRTSSASSSSSASDNSTFSGSSSSTATSVSPALAGHMKLSSVSSINLPTQVALGKAFHPRVQGPAFVRHHSTNSLPYVPVRAVVPAPTLVPIRPSLQSRASGATPLSTVAAPRRKHGASASVSSLGGGRGLLVLKEGPGTVTEHSGGKVGVMGGGVLLGLPKDNREGPATNKAMSGGRKVVGRRPRA